MSTKHPALAALVSVIAMSATTVFWAEAASAQFGLSYHEADETDRGFDLATADKVKLTSKRHVNLCLERDSETKLINKERLFLVVDTGTQNLCSQFYIFNAKGATENLGACSFAFPLTPSDSSVGTKKNEGVSITQVIVDNRAITNPDDDPSEANPPTLYGTLDWVVDVKGKNGSFSKASGGTYGELSLEGDPTVTALINDGSIKTKKANNDIVPSPLPEVDCDCGDGLFDEDGGEACDPTDLDDDGCFDGQICNATCSLCLGDPD